jgi:hypothetical protein
MTSMDHAFAGGTKMSHYRVGSAFFADFSCRPYLYFTLDNQSYQEFQRAAFQKEPAYRVRGILTDGFDSTVKSGRTLFPGARLGNCLRHAINSFPGN